MRQNITTMAESTPCGNVEHLDDDRIPKKPITHMPMTPANIEAKIV